MASILPKNGTLELVTGFFSQEESCLFQSNLEEEIIFRSQKIKIFGKLITEPRLVSWHGDEGISYTYSHTKMNALPWTPTLKKIKTRVEQFCQYEFNSVLINLYRSGNDHMGWHSDNEKELGTNPFIASISLGETRIFHLKHKTDKDQSTIRLPLADGSLLLMGGEIQHFWKHRISPSKKEFLPRINLTFRKIIL